MPEHFPLVSIAIPVYNGSVYLQETLKSIQQQTYPNIELIIVDDCSTDDTYELCCSWVSSYNLPVKLARNEMNRGLPATANILLQKAGGKYFQLLGQDDILLPGKIAEDVALFEHSTLDTALIYSKVKLINDRGYLTGEDYFERIGYGGITKEPIFIELLKKNFIPAPAVLLRTEMISSVGGYDESLMFEDWDMWLKLSKVYKVIFNDVCNVLYRIHPDSMMANRNDQQTILRNEANISMIKKHFGYTPEYDVALMKKLKELTIYSFFIGDKNAKTKMWTFLKKKPDLKMGLYFIMALVGLKHPSRVFNLIN